MIRSAAFVVVAALGCAPRPPDAPPLTCIPADDPATVEQAQLAISALSPSVELHVDTTRGGAACTAFGDDSRADCAPPCTAVDVGDVELQHDARVDVLVFDPSIVDLEVFNVGFAPGGCADAYLAGPPLDLVAEGTGGVASVVIRPTARGPCAVDVVVATDANNVPATPDGQSIVTLHISAHGVAPRGAVTGCTTDGACCCTSGAAPACVDGRVACDVGVLDFDDACNEASCTP